MEEFGGWPDCASERSERRGNFEAFAVICFSVTELNWRPNTKSRRFGSPVDCSEDEARSESGRADICNDARLATLLGSKWGRQISID